MLNSTNSNVDHPKPPRKKVMSERQLAANRANSQKSTGPRSPEGKNRARFNSIQHGLTADEVCLPGESREEYDRRRLEYIQDHRPATLLEAEILDDYIAARWRKQRAMRYEKCLLLEKFMQRRVNIGEQYESITLDVEAALAFRELGDESTALRKMNRYEMRILRDIQTGYRQLMELRANRPPIPSGLQPGAIEFDNDAVRNEAIPNNEQPAPNHPAPLTNATHTTVIPKTTPNTITAGQSKPEPDAVSSEAPPVTNHDAQKPTTNHQPLTTAVGSAKQINPEPSMPPHRHPSN